MRVDMVLKAAVLVAAVVVSAAVKSRNDLRGLLQTRISSAESNSHESSTMFFKKVGKFVGDGADVIGDGVGDAIDGIGDAIDATVDFAKDAGKLAQDTLDEVEDAAEGVGEFLNDLRCHHTVKSGLVLACEVLLETAVCGSSSPFCSKLPLAEGAVKSAAAAAAQCLMYKTLKLTNMCENRRYYMSKHFANLVLASSGALFRPICDFAIDCSCGTCVFEGETIDCTHNNGNPEEGCREATETLYQSLGDGFQKTGTLAEGSGCTKNTSCQQGLYCGAATRVCTKVPDMGSHLEKLKKKLKKQMFKRKWGYKKQNPKRKWKWGG